MVREVDLKSFAEAQAQGAFVIDVREPADYIEAHVPGALLMPLAQVLSRQWELPRDRPVYVVCASGDRSRTACDWLREREFDAVSVAGGMTAWTAAGLPVDHGVRKRPERA